MSQPERTDEELLVSARQGDEEAFAIFLRRHTATVHRWMVRAVGAEDADDMTQDVFLKAYRGLPRFRGDAPPRAWLAS
ncbi:MAG: sigma factor, partial [Acidobacteriota bacterium]